MSMGRPATVPAQPWRRRGEREGQGQASLNDEALRCLSKEFKFVSLQEKPAQISVMTWAES